MKSHYTHPSKPVHQFTPFLNITPTPRHSGKVSASDYDMAYFDMESHKVSALENPFGPKVLGM